MVVTFNALDSEVDIREKIHEGFKKLRIIDQPAFYLNEGANLYYNPKKTSSKKFSYDYSTISKSLKNIFKEKNESVAIVSLGCGNSFKEVQILNKLYEEGYNFSYLGVDSSMSMLSLADQRLNNLPYSSQLVCADFGSKNFRQEIEKLIGSSFDKKIFLLLGHTLGNINLGYVSDMLNNLTKTGDYLLIEIMGFPELTEEIKTSLFERYVSYLELENEIEFLLYPLRKKGLDCDKIGELQLEMLSVPSINSLIYQFLFTIKKDSQLKINQEVISFTEGESIELLDIYVYNTKELIQFFNKKGFEHVSTSRHESFSNILFRKK